LWSSFLADVSGVGRKMRFDYTLALTFPVIAAVLMSLYVEFFSPRHRNVRIALAAAKLIDSPWKKMELGKWQRLIESAFGTSS